MQSGIAGTAERRVDWEMDEAHGLALEHRGLSVETAVQLGWRPCAGPTSDLWISVPYIDNGKRVGSKYRSLTGPKMFTQDKGTPQILWNVDCMRNPDLAGFPLVITEGECDALAAIQSGFPKTVSVPGGAPDHDNGDEGTYWNYLLHAKPLLQEQKLIVLATDADHNGVVLRDGLAQRLGRSRCQILHYPSGKDLNDVLKAHGEFAVRKTIATARYVPLPGLVRLSDMKERVAKQALDTMIPGLEPHMRIRSGDLIVITGPPGHGKSTFVASLLCNMAWHWHTVSAMASLEQAVMPDLRRTLRSYRAECLEKYMSDQQKSDADAWINQHFIFLQNEDADEEMTLDWMLERFAAAHTRYGAHICVIDPWNEVSIAGKPVEWTTEQWVSQSLKEIKRFARLNDVTMIIVAHPAKMRRDRNGKTPKPGLWDIADSASWANRCDLGVIVYRPDVQGDDGVTEISVEKSRDYYAIGKPGIVSLHWNQDASKFEKRDW